MESLSNLIKNTIEQAKKMGIEILLVEADKSKGFEYSYLLMYPQNKNEMKNTLVLNSLNNYGENNLSQNEIENVNARNSIHSFFGDKIILSTYETINTEKEQEKDNKTLERLEQRYRDVVNQIMGYPLLFLQAKAPVCMPLIPGYKGDSLKNCPSELSADLAKELSPQITAMIVDAKKIILEKTGKKLSEEILAFGHSKEATLVNNYTLLNPENVKSLVIGGMEEPGLPIEEIRLIICNKKSENENFFCENGIVYKRVTNSEFELIKNEYNVQKQEFQKEIGENEDGSFSLPLNYPVGISDIEHFRGFDDKIEYQKKLRNISRVIFVGEYEDEIDGDFAYSECRLQSGKEIKYGTHIIEGEENYRIEKASMHNRILEYQEAMKILFGRSSNERLNNYLKLFEIIGLKCQIQAKIYADYGHFRMFQDENLQQDFREIYEDINKGKEIRELGNEGRVSRINPMFQLLRRMKVSNSEDEYKKICSSLPESSKGNQDKAYYDSVKEMLNKINDAMLSQVKSISDRDYDDLDTEKLRQILIPDRINNLNEKNILNKKNITNYIKTRDVALEYENCDEIVNILEKQIDDKNYSLE